MAKPRQRKISYRWLTDQEMVAAVESCIPLAASMAKRYSKKWPHLYQEFFAEAESALKTAAMSFDPSRGVKFITWAYRPVWHAMVGEYHKARCAGFTGGVKGDRQVGSLDYQVRNRDGRGETVHSLMGRSFNHDTRRMEAMDSLNGLRQVAIELGIWNDREDGDSLDMMIRHCCYEETCTALGKEYGMTKEAVRQRIFRLKGLLYQAAEECRELECV